MNFRIDTFGGYYDSAGTVWYDDLKIEQFYFDTLESLITTTDYYPFGSPMPGRTIVGDYRYAFQGQEKDPETGKEAFQLRLWDSRIGRWLTTDPYRQYASPYLGMGNNPITKTDSDGGKADDWYTDADGNYVWDSRITSQQDLTTYDIEGTYIGETFSDFNVGQMGDINGNLFSTNGNLITSFLDGIEISRFKYLDIYRDIQTVNSTTSTFAFGDVNGFFLEPAGPDTTISGQNRRIPAGRYNLTPHNGTDYKDVYKLYNDQVPQSRAILIHTGNVPKNTEGCLLPGCYRDTDFVGRSDNKRIELQNAIGAAGVKNVVIRIHNRFNH